MAEITKPTPDRPFLVPNYVWLALALLGLIAYFSGLSLPLVGPDEPRYAQAAREMFERGDWITPTLGGHTWFEKPALLYWLQIVAYKVFGVTEFAARLGPALSGLGIVFCLWILGRSIDTGLSRDRSNWLALIGGTTFGILVFAHGASFDILITFTLTAALVSYFLFDQTDRKVPLILFYVFVGLSLLAKGLIGVVFPVGIAGLYLLITRRRPTKTFVTSLLWGTLITLVIASVWYVPVYMRHGWLFIDQFIIQHHFQRFTSNKYQHPQPFYFFLWVLPLMTLPWLPLFVGGLLRFTKNAFKDLRGIEPIFAFALSWVIVPLAFFSISGSKLPGYILPALPGAILIAGLYLMEKVNDRRWSTAALSCAAVVLAGCIAGIYTIVPTFADRESVKSLLEAGRDTGFGDVPLYSLHTVVHGTEFYAAGHLLRESNGDQKKLYGTSEVISEMQRAGARRALVMVPLEYQHQLDENTALHAKYLKDNGEVAIYAVTLN